MKNKILIGLFLAVFAVTALFVGQSFGPPPPKVPGKILSKTFAADTITNTESDTLLLSSLISDAQYLYTYSYLITRSSLSGTANTAIKIEESNTSAGTDWVSVGTGAGTGVVTERLTGSELFGRRQRLIITGTGTQSTRYVVTACLKLKFYGT